MALAVVFLERAGPGSVCVANRLFEALFLRGLRAASSTALYVEVARRRWVGETSPTVVLRLTA